MPAHQPLNLGEQIVPPRREPSALDRRAHDGRIHRCDPGLAHQGERGRRAPVNELGAELDGNGQAGHVERPDATADTVARLEDKGRFTGARKLRGGRQPGGTGTQDYDDA